MKRTMMLVPFLVISLLLSMLSVAWVPRGGVTGGEVYVAGDDETHTPEPTCTPEPTSTPKPTCTPESEEYIAFEGAVEAVNNDGSYIIAGQMVLTDENTEFEPNRASVAVGARVEVKAMQQADGSLLASKIKVKECNSGEDEHGAQVEFEGSVEAVNGNTYVIAGQTVLVTADTKFEPDQASIVVGVWVKVKALALSDGSLLVVEIELQHDNGSNSGVEEVEFQGIVEAMNGNVITVAGVAVDLSGATIENGPVGVGDVVKVEATRMADGSLVAGRIEVKGSADSGGGDEYRPQVEFKGQVEAINGNVYTIAGIAVDASSAAIENGPIAVGDMVEVEGVEQADGSVLAAKLHKEMPAEEAAQVEFTATIQSMGADTITCDNGMTVTVDGNTIIDESKGMLEIGAKVEVKALDQNGSLLALSIKVERED